ncbi:MAG: type II CAAX prenyl endopeptidase Rce1 family protein, partial [Myxococcota bacterium]
VLRRRGELHPRLFPWVLLESSVYAVLFGTVVNTLVQWLGLGALLAAGFGPGNALVMSMGAGLYEEVVFRLLLMGGLYRLLSLRSGPTWWAGVLSLLVSSFVFSAIHHVGSLGEAFTLSAFIFRFVAGAVLAAIYALRGLGVAVYTHAIYDVIVLVVLAN